MRLIKKIQPEKIKNNWQYYGLFLCEYCNKEVKKHMSAVKQKSCGCMHDKLVQKAKIKHGDSFKNDNKRLYRIWIHVKSRCSNSNEKCYKNYGGKGIKVYEQWKENYIIFKIWALANGYKDHLTIDRIDSDKDYCPTNCKWVTKAINSRRTNRNKLSIKKARQIRSLYFNIKITQSLISRIFKTSRRHIWDILHNKQWIEYHGN